MYRSGRPARRTAAGHAGKRGPAGLAITAVVLSALLSGCGIRLAHSSVGAPPHRMGHGVLAAAGGTVSGHQPRQHRAGFQTTRTFWLGAGPATRTFTLREPSGVVVRSQLTIRHGVRAYVDAQIPGAEVEVWSWASRNDPAASCRRDGAFDVCTQGEEWCPMPQATWYLRLVKVGGPAGPVRFDFVVAAPPGTAG